MSEQVNATPIVAESTPSEQPAVETPEITAAPEVEAKEEAPSKAEAKAAEKKFLKQLKLKIDGKEISEDLPFEIPDDPKAVEYMQRQLQLGKMGQSRAQEKAELEKKVAQFIETLRKNPRAVLSDPTIGVDVKQLAAQILEEEIANSQKTPEQLEKEQLQQQLKQMQEERQREQEEFQRREFQRLQEVEFERYNTSMDKTLSESDLPKSDYVKKKMADYMLLGLQQGMDLSPEDVLPLVRDEVLKDLKNMFEVMPEDVIEKFVGKEKLNNLRKKNLAKAKEKPATPVGAIKDVAAKKAAAPAKKMTLKQMFGV